MPGKGWAGAAWAAGQTTEGLDFWNAILDAAGFKYVPKWRWAGHWHQPPNWTPSRFGQQVQFVANGGLDGIDWVKAFGNIVGNAVEDFAYGYAGSKSNHHYVNALNDYGHNRPFGLGSGPLL